jgi:DNA-binding transcriptional MerR regulator/ubiquinone/menaquinone biosynthesis C-methylase UbiE
VSFPLAYRISELAKLVGLTRTTLLYYEKQGLITGKRQSNGYRIYSDKDLQRLRLLRQLQVGGLTLRECQACLDAKLDRSLLENRLLQLDAEITKKQEARELLSALLGQRPLRHWHETTDRLAPDALLDWLKQQGFDEKEALHLKWLSKDMNEHERYMADFMTVYHALDRWGPGSKADTLRALQLLPSPPTKVVDIGCGKGLSTILLAQNTQANITAVDNEINALSQLQRRIEEQGLSQRVITECASMTELHLADESFDLVWAEGSAYIMGVENALTQWRTLLKPQGCMVLSDLVWLTETPSQTAREFWQQEYPDMKNVETRITQMQNADFDVLNHFTLSRQAWLDYVLPLKERVAELQNSMSDSAALEDLAREIELYDQHLGEFGYEMFILQVKKS